MTQPPKHPLRANRLSELVAKSPKISRPGYEYLVTYMLGLVIQELTDEFCQRFLTPKSPNTPNPEFRQIQQMTQAARSNPSNIAEGYTQESLKSYIYLSGIAHGSNEELAKDYQDFLKQRDLPIWGKAHPKVRKFREFRVVWKTSTSLNTPTLPNSPTQAANLILTLCQMDGYLLKKLVNSLKGKHRTEGGLSEELYHARIAHRKARRAGKTRKDHHGY